MIFVLRFIFKISFLIPVDPACSPVREGQSTTLSCNVNTQGCSSNDLLSWRAGGEEAARCTRDQGCFGADSSISVNLRSTLTINSVSRTDPFDMEVKWTCEICPSGTTTVCDKLEVYGEFTYCTYFCTFNHCLYNALFYITYGA